MLKKERIIYIDVLRIMGCLMVIYNHSRERGFLSFLYREPGSLSFFLHLLCSIICKNGVPIFFMISGSLLLSKDESLKDTYKRIPRVAIDLILFSLLYFWWDAKLSGSPFVLKDIIKTMIITNYWHLWYLYAYITLIITLPFLRKLVRGLDEKSSLYMLVIAAFYMAVIPIIRFHLGGINQFLQPSWLVVSTFIYPVAGYMLDRVFQIEALSLKFILGIGGGLFAIGLIISGIYEYWYLIKVPGSNDETFLINFCLVCSVVIFAATKKLLMEFKFGNAAATLLSEIGKCTFGVYLLHIWVLWKIPFFYNVWMWIEQDSIFGQSIGIIITTLLVFCTCVVITYCLRKMPFMRKIF